MNITAEQLRSYIERIEKLEVEKVDISGYIKDIYTEAKGNGYDVKALREIIKLRKKTASERDEEEYMLDVYKKALGMIPDFDESN